MCCVDGCEASTIGSASEMTSGLIREPSPRLFSKVHNIIKNRLVY
jgi:hypothetical protein